MIIVPKLRLGKLRHKGDRVLSKPAAEDRRQQRTEWLTRSHSAALPKQRPPQSEASTEERPSCAPSLGVPASSPPPHIGQQELWKPALPQLSHSTENGLWLAAETASESAEHSFLTVNF